MRAIGILLLMCVGTGCAADGVPSNDRMPISASCNKGEVRGCTCDDGSTGEQTCSTGWGACRCAAAPIDEPNFNNAPPDAGAVGPSTTEPEPQALEHCDPGLYLGTYDCDLNFLGVMMPFMGDVSFNLEINEMARQECDPLGEFCADLVITEGSGTLFGIAAAFWGFEAPLKGGLDCNTGEFRTEPLDGIWGSAVSSDPTDPNALWTVADPPAGTFSGELGGMHSGTEPQAITGDWNLLETASMSTCVGPFSVQLQK